MGYETETKNMFKWLILIGLVLVFLALSIFGGFLSKTSAYFTGSGTVYHNIVVQGVNIKVKQRKQPSEQYVDVTETGFDPIHTKFAPNTNYSYDIILQNNEVGVTAGQYYIRWKIMAIIDNTEYNITEYVSINGTMATKQTVDDEVYFYSNNQLTETPLNLMNTINFTQTYDAETDSYVCILDNETSGSDVTLLIKIEGSLTGF